jgi:RNA methyltransferase, TrmH family
MRYLTSRKNEFVQKIKYLHTKRGRDDLSLFIVEGEKLAREAMNMSDVDCVVVSETFGHMHEDDLFLDTVVLKDDVFEYVSGTENPQGIIALVKYRNTVIEKTRFELLAEDLQDPGNLGTVIRTCESFGVEAVGLTANCADPYNLKSVRASMGSILRVPVRNVDYIGDYIQAKKCEGFRILAGHLEGNDIGRGHPGKYEKILLVIGNESRGIGETTAGLCDELLRIPIYGGNESLNVSVAAGILLYEIRSWLI